jgi:hypothetical protein
VRALTATVAALAADVASIKANAATAATGGVDVNALAAAVVAKMGSELATPPAA